MRFVPFSVPCAYHLKGRGLSHISHTEIALNLLVKVGFK